MSSLQEQPTNKEININLLEEQLTNEQFLDGELSEEELNIIAAGIIGITKKGKVRDDTMVSTDINMSRDLSNDEEMATGDLSNDEEMATGDLG